MAKKDIAVVSAYIELTSKCNMTCRHCYNDSGVAGKSLIKSDEFTKLVLKLRQLHCEHIILSGGEPLIHPEICNFITKASSLGIRDISVITNGLIFNNEFARVCHQNGVTVVISMDGPDMLSYSLFRKEENFQHVLAHVIQYAQNCEVEINMVLSKRNYMVIEDMAKFAVQNGIKKINLLNLTCTGRAVDFYEVAALDNRELEECRNNIRKAVKAYPEVQFLGAVNPIVVNTCRYLIPTDNPEYHVRIDSIGNMYLCSAATKIAGNLLFQELDEIRSALNGAVTSEMRKQFVKLYSDCRTCEVQTVCRKGCPLSFTDKKQMRAYCEDCRAGYKKILDQQISIKMENMV